MIDSVSVPCFYNPCSLIELSMKSIFGVDCEQSIGHLMQLSCADVLEAATIVKRKSISFSKYERISESSSGGDIFPSEWNDFCSMHFNLFVNSEEIAMVSSVTYLMEAIFLDLKFMFPSPPEILFTDDVWKSNPVYQLVNSKSKDGAGICYEKIDDLLLLSDPDDHIDGFALPIIGSSGEEKLFYYYDPLCFFPVHNPRSGSRCISGREIRESMSFMISSSRKIMSNLVELRYCIGKNLYNLSIIALLQMEKTFSEVDSIGQEGFIGRKQSIIESLKLITCLRNIKNDVRKIEDVIFPAMQYCNFVPLEDMLRLFELVDSDLYKNEIVMLVSIIKIKCQDIIETKKSKIELFLRKIEQNEESNNLNEERNNLYELSFTQVYVGNVGRSLEKLSEEIEEMEVFLRYLSIKCE
ncbi:MULTISPECIES: hypothetical protein [Candidatus Ichthyocystis]|uniref:Putative coiled coil protein n=1 Tax=Candidatus Ichthyocystis hellenicum TaxID=1561003 RepID=A0A0S4M7B7_9BURK|nr:MULTISPECIES: hypothetical protein [Ichthyocystis]CUT18157.1 putative coiled coil protein [Candidatus Ichthyocystis hellenicum]